MSGEATPGANNSIQFAVGTAASPSTRMTLNKDGNVLINPAGGSTIQFGTPNFETGMTISGGNRADVRFDGSTLKLLAGAGVDIPPTGNGIAINTAGIREHDLNQLFVAFTATACQATLDPFGNPFDTYSEAEAIAEGYIMDVATSIISYKTLYNLHCHFVPKPDEEERVYPKGVVAKALTNVVYQDDGLIQYKAEVMLRIFEEKVIPLIGGRAKAMIVATSRVAGLRYFNIIKEKLKERGAKYKVLYAFSDFTHPETNDAISEHAVNGLKEGELIEERLEGEDYRLMIEANKFQTGFDQPLLAGMFLDKAVEDSNAVQTLSRLNRCHEGKDEVVVVDFTNNAAAILKVFQKYRKGTPFVPEEPSPDLCPKLYAEILAAGVFTQKDATDTLKLVATGTDAQVQFAANAVRIRFLAKVFGVEERKAFVYLLPSKITSCSPLCLGRAPPKSTS